MQKVDTKTALDILVLKITHLTKASTVIVYNSVVFTNLGVLSESFNFFLKITSQMVHRDFNQLTITQVALKVNI